VSPQHVAVISRRPTLVAEISRLCAMAGQQVQLASSEPDIARVCRSAALVVVDDCSVDAVATLGAIRSDVVVVTDDPEQVTTWRAAVRLGARRVVALPAGAAELLDLLAMASERRGAPGPLVGVIGGRGGAGASTLTVALGWALAQRSAATMLVDLDPAGGGLDVALGLENATGLRWPDLRESRGVVSSSALRDQLPSRHGITVVSAAKRPDQGALATDLLPDRDALRSVVDAGRRGGGVVVADLPRYSFDVVDAVVADCTVVLLVVPADVRAVAAATAVARRLHPMCDDLRVVVRLDVRTRLRERDVVTALGFDHAATIRTETGLTAATDRAQLLEALRRSRLGRSARTLAGVVVPVDAAAS